MGENFNMDVSMKFYFLFLFALTAWTQTAEAKWSVSTYNIRNFDSRSTNLKELSRILKEVKSDVMAFEEVVNARDFDNLLKRNLGGYKYELSTCGGGGKQLLAIAYDPKTFEFVSKKEDLTFSSGGTTCGSLRPGLIVTLKEKRTGKIYTFGAFHLKAGGNSRAFSQRWKQYQLLTNIAREYAQENLILLGDLNTTGYNVRNKDYAKFQDFLNDGRLRTTSENLGCTSYWMGEDRDDSDFESSILDHIVVQDKDFRNIQEVKLGSHCARLACREASWEEMGESYQTVSDHCPIQVTFR